MTDSTTTASGGTGSRIHTVAAVQAEPCWFDLGASVEKTVDYIEAAKRAGASLVAFPELWLPGYPFHAWFDDDPNTSTVLERLRASSMELGGPEHRRLERAAGEAGVHVVLGFSERVDDRLYISQLLIDADGTTLMTRRKLRPTGPEGQVFSPGNAAADLRVVSTDIGRVGALNCNEHRRPMLRHTMLAQGEEIHIASWPSHALFTDRIPMTADASMRFSRQYAIEGGVYVLAPTMVVSERFWELVPVDARNRASIESGHGATRIFDPAGQDAAVPLDPEAEGLVVARIDLDALPRTYDPDPLGEAASLDAG